ADFGAVDGDAAVVHLLERSAAWVGAQNAWWMAVVRIGGNGADAYGGWRPGAIRYLWEAPADREFYREARRQVLEGQVDESVRANLLGAGKYRVNWLPEQVSPEWYDSPFYKLAYEARG